MRGSDVVDLAVEVAPRWLVRAAAMVLLGWVIVTGNVDPIEWYVNDKAQALVSVVLDPLTSQSAIQPPAAPASESDR